MSESALRTLIANFEGSRSSHHAWFEFWTTLVAIGVVLEVVFIILEYLGERRDFRRGTMHTLERPRILLLVLALIGSGLVALGVSGELYEDDQIEHAETKIRQTNDELYLLLSEEAGDAKQSAQIADTAASGAQSKADAVAKETGSISDQLHAASTELRGLQQVALPRVLTNKQKTDLKSYLSTQHPSGVLTVRYWIMDQEAQGYAIQIAKAFDEGGWNAVAIGDNIWRFQCLLGTTGIGSCADAPQNYVQSRAEAQDVLILQGALAAAHIYSPGGVGVLAPKYSLYIYVGPRPLELPTKRP